MSVLLTGATGFLGCRILRELLARGEDVTVLGRGTPEELRARVDAAVTWLDAPPLADEALAGVRYVSGDLTQPGLGLTSQDRARVTEGLTGLWHCAAMIVLEGDPALLHHANVIGTRRVLELADEAPDARVLFLSTAYVAGRRRSGHVKETDLLDRDGFQTLYEESKYTAERLLHAWARAEGRDVTVFRPSLLVTDRPVPAGLPEQPTDVAIRFIENAMRNRTAEHAAERELLGGPRGDAAQQPEILQYRIEGDPEGTLNLLQADYAARAMVLAASCDKPAPGVRTLHVTHPQSVRIATVTGALQTRFPGLLISITPELSHPTIPEQLIAKHGTRLLTFSAQRRSYDRSNLLATVGDLPAPDPVDHDYLLRAFAGAEAPAHV
ncbi:SDR family oxidoreductase [Streptomyces enissocaesilis]|uniref:SDR family oxidoreductase n=1 Tax=Streptomyces enissocaesilis TaxID=332589 RepID=A0ABN3XNH2_9ACTN